MDYKVEECIERIESIKNQIQEKGYIDKSTYSSIVSDVEKLKEIVKQLDKDLAIGTEKNAMVYLQLEILDKKIEELKKSYKSKDDKKRESTEKIMLLVLGAILSFIFNKFT